MSPEGEKKSAGRLADYNRLAVFHHRQLRLDFNAVSRAISGACRALESTVEPRIRFFCLYHAMSGGIDAVVLTHRHRLESSNFVDW